MVLLTTTPRILKAIASIPSESLTPSDSSKKVPESEGQPIEHTLLVSLSKLSNFSLDDLLRGTRVYVPPPAPKPAQSPEYVALMARLRAEQEQRDYVALIDRHSRDYRGEGGEGEADGDDDISPSLVLNILLSIVMCAGVALHVTRYWQNDGSRVLVSLATGLIVGTAEVTVYAAYLRKVAESKRKERRKKEKKTLIGEYASITATEKMEQLDRELDERTDRTTGREETIWGRGVNGGVRQRVRDKWERGQEQDREQVKEKGRQDSRNDLRSETR